MPDIERDKCYSFCAVSSQLNENEESTGGKPEKKKSHVLRARRSEKKKPVVIYSWQSDDPLVWTLSILEAIERMD